jgi:hypothetical protein
MGQSRGAMKIIAERLSARGKGTVFKVADLEAMVQEATGRHRTEVDRRLRDLRAYGWSIASYKTDPILAVDELRVDKIGERVWESGWRPAPGNSCPSGLRQSILHRDNSTCQTCGVRAGDTYCDNPEINARLTIARKIPATSGGEYSLRNCYVECARCNEQERDTYVHAIRLCAACGGTGEARARQYRNPGV